MAEFDPAYALHGLADRPPVSSERTPCQAPSSLCGRSSGVT